MSATLDYQAMPYIAEPGAALHALGGEQWSAWLDSGHPGQGSGRFDILVARPAATLVMSGGVTRLARGSAVRYASGNPLEHLDELLSEFGEVTSDPDLPFVGGALGYFTYDLGRRLLGIGAGQGEQGRPEMAVGIYECAIVTDHLRRYSVAVGKRLDHDWLALVRDRLGEYSSLSSREGTECQGYQPFRLEGEILVEPTAQAYAEQFRRVQEYLHAGDCYQVNLARRFTAPFSGDPQSAYLALRACSPAPFAAWMRSPRSDLLSFSPERFLSVDAQRRVVTEPIKGTRPRGINREQDQDYISELSCSSKDRAENVMIVDLLRNDLGKGCKFGTVKTTELCQVHSYASVHHLVSRITGQLGAGYTPLALLHDCLPGGSITGAPKRRAMEIIDELEPGPRRVYCGSIGYIGFDGRMDSNIAIRTAICERGQVTYWAGGGVVVDSTLDAELQETVDKAYAFLRLAQSSEDKKRNA
ncbi:aminodeoxychorismate synthase component I [Halorhodospira halochloris]|uniref:aminodeoxychorismate synthase component I n=1 Tax=Halorhodospira halochloris TaxID=1052 RepID=UPI001EE91320|nr:aminodeoxychorismate synthase component I [Halorhodospira halochloris]